MNYVLKGEDAGPAKISKAESYQIPIIEEDDLLDMIRKKSGLETKENGDDNSEDTENNKSKENSAKDKENTQKKLEEKQKSKKQSPPKKTKQSKHTEKSRTKKEEKLSPKKSSTKNETVGEKPKPKKIIDLENYEAKQEENKPIPKKDSTEPSVKRVKVEQTPTKKGKPVEETKVKPEIKEETTSTIKSGQNLAWVEKYKPTDINRIIGQQGDGSCAKKLQNWLKNWYTNQNGKTKLTRPSPWAKNDNGAFFKAALLSGPPGIGKTTSATLISQQLGFDLVEFNASDTRNKRLIHDEIGQILNTTSISGYFKDEGKTSKKHVLIMDEVDGMSGNEDRGGMQELISLIKTTSIPIICICNDRNHQKIRTLANYCFDLRFNKPRMEQIRGYLMTICFQEDLDVKPNILAEIINGTGQDIRQSINNLYMWSNKSKSLTMDDAQKGAQSSQRDAMMTQWDVVKKVFTIQDQKNMDITERARLFFNDYSIGPLFVYENYLHVQPEDCK